MKVFYKGSKRISVFGNVTIVSSSNPDKAAIVYYGPAYAGGSKDPTATYPDVCESRQVCGHELSWSEWGWLLSEQGPLMVHCGLWQPDPYVVGEYCS